MKHAVTEAVIGFSLVVLALTAWGFGMPSALVVMFFCFGMYMLCP